MLVGPNGSGKSTLLKLLGGELTPQQGKVIQGHNAKIGYFSQHRSATLNPNNSVLTEVLEAAPTCAKMRPAVSSGLSCSAKRKSTK